MKIYTVTTLVEDTYSGSSAYSEPFLTEEDMEEYYEAEIEYMKDEYGISENNIDEFTALANTASDGVIKKTEMLVREGIYIDIAVRVFKK